MKICHNCGHVQDEVDEVFDDHNCDNEPDFFFEDLRPIQPKFFDVRGMPDPIEEAIREAVGKVIQ